MALSIMVPTMKKQIQQIIINSLNQPINYQGKKVLLICKEIEAVNPTQLEIQEEAL
uniref:Uncharacterized protein n=1 Tax=Loa loa TaxID=7209 RepID=A0A1I7V7M2_LOALO